MEIFPTPLTLTVNSEPPLSGLETLTANLGAVRREVVNGHEYFIAPVTLLVSGVLNGSQGSLYYPPDEVSKPAVVDAWNGFPLVHNHPADKEGRPVSARNPMVLAKHKLGRVYNVNHFRDEQGRQGWRGEAWFHVASTKRVSPKIYASLVAGQPIEVSTGLYTRNDATGGTVDNKAYTHIARDYRPDHLAVLSDSRGACSVADGCGVHNSQNANSDTPTGGSGMDRTATINWLVANCDCWKGQGDAEVLNKFDDAKLASLKKTAEKVKEQELAINTLQTDLTKAKATPAPTATPVVPAAPVTPAPVVNTAPPTAEQWLAAAPAEIQSVVRNAMETELREKQGIVERLTANITDPALKKSHGDFFLTKGLAELRMMATILPVQNTPTREPWLPTNYAGAAGAPPSGAGVTQNQDAFASDALPRVTLEFTPNDPDVAYRPHQSKVG
jgi:hypothetical protein